MARLQVTYERVRARFAAQHESPPSPPSDESEAEAESLNGVPADEAFITGNGIAWQCRWIRNYGRPIHNERGRRGWYFCKTDYLDWFFAREAPDEDFVLVSHNSDLEVGDRFRRHLRNRRLRAWLAANVAIEHTKLRPLPLGIANPHWRHGDADELQRVCRERRPKERSFDVSFSAATNPPVRLYCLEQTGLRPEPMLPFPAYLERLAASRFSVCPRGNGIDTHRVWESLYVRTIPVVIRTPLTDAHPELPLIVLDDWSAFRSINFSPELYERMWGDWDPDELRLDAYLARVAAGVP